MALDVQLDKTKSNLLEILKPVVDINNELQKSATNYKTLTDLINKQNQVEAKAIAELEKHREIIKQMKILQDKLISSQSQQAKEIEMLRSILEERKKYNDEIQKSVIAKQKEFEESTKSADGIKQEGIAYKEMASAANKIIGLRSQNISSLIKEQTALSSAKQVIIQKLRETERNMIFNEYNERKGEIVTGLVQKADNHIVVLDLGKLEGIMLSKDQIPTEHYKVNDKIKAYVVDVERGEKGAPQAIVSRTHPDFVRKLLEFEIPEIYEGLIEIKSVARDPGQRCKVAVYSQNENIDPVGSCVGQKGIRIQNVINELNGEKIDVIEWNPDPSTFLASALLPAQIMAVDIKEEEKFAQVIVQDDQLSLAIGKSGQNVRLAAKLTGWKIDIKTETQFRELLAQKTEEPEKEESESKEVQENVEE